MIVIELGQVNVAIEEGDVLGPEGEPIKGKRLLFQDPQSGIVVRIPMVEDACEALSNALRPSGVIIARQVPPGRGLPTSPLKA